MATKTMTVRVDEETYDQFCQVLDDIGIDFSTAVRMFIKQTIREEAIPFKPGKPSAYQAYQYELAMLDSE